MGDAMKSKIGYAEMLCIRRSQSEHFDIVNRVSTRLDGMRNNDVYINVYPELGYLVGWGGHGISSHANSSVT